MDEIKPIELERTPSVIKIISDMNERLGVVEEDLKRFRGHQIDNNKDIINLKTRVKKLDGRM